MNQNMRTCKTCGKEIDSMSGHSCTGIFGGSASAHTYEVEYNQSQYLKQALDKVIAERDAYKNELELELGLHKAAEDQLDASRLINAELRRNVATPIPGDDETIHFRDELWTKESIYNAGIDKCLIEIKKLKEVLQTLLYACDQADMEGELSSYIDGSFLDNARDVLKEIKNE